MILNKAAKEEAHFYKNIANILKHDHLSHKDLSELSGISLEKIESILSKTSAPTGRMIQDISKAVQISPYTLTNLKLPKMDRYRICLEKRFIFADQITVYSAKEDRMPRKLFYQSGSLYVTFHIYQDNTELFFSDSPIPENWKKVLDVLYQVVISPENGYEIRLNYEAAKILAEQKDLHISTTIDDMALSYGVYGYKQVSISPMHFKQFIISNYEDFESAKKDSVFYRQYPAIIPRDKANVNRIALYQFSEDQKQETD